MTGRPAANASMAVSPPAFSTSASDAAISAGISSVQPRTVPAEALLDERREQLLVAAADGDRVVGPGFRDRVQRLGDVADAPRSGDDEHDPLVVVDAEPPAHLVAVGDLVAEPVRDERSAGAVVVAAPLAGGLGRHRAHGKVEVDAGVHPQGVDREVGEIGRDRDAQPLLLAHPAEHQRRHRIRGDHRVGAGPAQLTFDGAAGQEAHQPHDRAPHHRRREPERLVAELVAPRHRLQLGLVRPAAERAQLERHHRQEVDDGDVVVAGFEAFAEFPRCAVVTRAHRRRDDQDPSAHRPTSLVVAPDQVRVPLPFVGFVRFARPDRRLSSGRRGGSPRAPA